MPLIFRSNEEAFSLILEAIRKAGYRPGKDIGLGIDAAASEFYKNGSYFLKAEKRAEEDLLRNDRLITKT